MEVMFLDAPYGGKLELCKDTLDYLRKYEKVAVYASVQFVHHLDEIKQQLRRQEIEVVTSRPARCHVEGQLLGCDCSKESLNLKEEVDCFLYVGDGKFHPLALVYAQKDGFKEVICDDPIGRKMVVFGKKEVEAVLRKHKGSLLKFHTSKKVGVIVSIKPGQEQLKLALQLEKKHLGKKFYYFLDDKVSFDQLENFPFIDVWVNTACPRIGLDEQEKFRRGVVNIGEIL